MSHILDKLSIVYRFFRFDIPSISLHILGISLPMPLSYSEKPERLKISGILHETFGLTIALLA